MKKIYLKNSNESMPPSRIIDADNLSFVFNRTDGSIYATSSASAKTSSIKILKHPDWKGAERVDRLNFETTVMDILSKALDHLFSTSAFELRIEFNCSETSAIYTFMINRTCLGTDDYILFLNKLEIRFFHGKWAVFNECKYSK